jgi:exocyst complex component 2
MYDTDLARKDDSDTIRNALNVIQRYRFIFHLPQTIERSVKRVQSINFKKQTIFTSWFI